ncbi:hypothetical protein SDC9_70381 [bioreactor metagenome]|uniref:Uncharacterized protein n=1 Tax=bioreactor metagenome TaxID=1076179 RepID=A0A644YCP4_9ZZZZ
MHVHALRMGEHLCHLSGPSVAAFAFGPFAIVLLNLFIVLLQLFFIDCIILLILVFVINMFERQARLLIVDAGWITNRQSEERDHFIGNLQEFADFFKVIPQASDVTDPETHRFSGQSGILGRKGCINHADHELFGALERGCNILPFHLSDHIVAMQVGTKYEEMAIFGNEMLAARDFRQFAFFVGIGDSDYGIGLHKTRCGSRLGAADDRFYLFWAQSPIFKIPYRTVRQDALDCFIHLFSSLSKKSYKIIMYILKECRGQVQPGTYF